MRKLYALVAVLASFAINSAYSQTVTVSGSTGADGSGYTTLKAAFDALNTNTTQTGNNIVITVSGTTVESASAVLNNPSGGNWTTLTINPTGGAAASVTGTIASAPLVDLNGVSNVTINGLNSGGNSLTISNSSTLGTAGTSTIRFINDAVNNTVTNTTVLGSNNGVPTQNLAATTTTTGTILFSNSTGTLGNSNNTISNNNIGDASGMPTVAISSSGQSTTVANSNNTITGNNIYNFYGSSGANGIAITANSAAWTISSNRFYVTTSTSGMSATNYWEAIFINTASGGGYTVSNNTIGYSSSAGTGTFTNNGGNLVGVDMQTVAASPISTVSGNVVNNINWTTSSNYGVGAQSAINGILALGGGVTIGGASLGLGNTIGATSGAASTSNGIYLTGTISGVGIEGIFVSSSTNCTIQNNTVGAMATGSAAAIGHNIYGIWIGGSGSHSVYNNTVGTATANSIAAGTSGVTTAATKAIGFLCSATGTTESFGNGIGTGNVVQNVSSFGLSNTSSLTGMSNQGICGTMNMNYNTFTGLTLAGGGSAAGSIYLAAIINSGAVTAAANINNNVINSMTSSIASFGGTAGHIFNLGAAATANVSVNNNTLSALNYTGTTGGASASTTFVIYTAGGTPLNETVSGNNINNLSLKTAGTIYLIYNNCTISANGSMTVQNNFVTTGVTRSVVATTASFYCYYDAATFPATTTVTVSGNNFSNINTNSTAGSGSFYGIYELGGATSPYPTKNIYNNTVSNITHAGTGTVYSLYTAYYQGTAATPCTFHDNKATGFTLASPGTVYGMYTGTNTFLNRYSNKIDNYTITGAPFMYGLYLSGGASLLRCYNDTISNVTMTGAGTIYSMYNLATIDSVYQNSIHDITCGGSLYGMYNSGTTQSVYSHNTSGGNDYSMYNLKTTGASSLLYGIYNSSTTNLNAYNNIVRNLQGTGTTSPTVYGMYNGGGTAANFYGNQVYTLTNAGTTSPLVNGILVSSGTTVNVFQNKIYDLSLTAAATTTPVVTGLLISGGTTVNAYNNLIGDLRAASATTASTTTDIIRGISVTSASTATYGIYFNTVYLSASSTGTNFPTAGLFHTGSATATTGKLDLRNNIIINNSTPAGTGKAVAFRRSSTSLTNYASTSDRNMFYAGTPGTANLLMYDGTNSYQTLTTYQPAVSPRDVNSFTNEAGFTYSTAGSFFQSLAGSSANFLHPVAGITTRVESGALPISSPSITTDYDGAIRNTSNPDMGAVEFIGVTPAPSLSGVTTPTQTCTATSHVINATITTPSGTITGAILNYAYNGAAQTGITMTNPSGNLWTGTIPAATSPVNATITWSITATNNSSLSTTYTGITYSDAPLTGVTAAATASSATICEGNPVTLTATLSKAGTVSVGSGSNTSTLGTDGTPYRVGNTVGNQFKNQYLWKASELTAAGLKAGNITGIKLNLVGTGGGTLSNFTIKVGTTGLTAVTTTYVTGLSTVLTLGTYPSSGTVTTGLQTHVFTTPFFWDGTSNIIIEICAQLATAGSAGTLSGDDVGFAATINNNPTTTACASGTAGTATFTIRPNVIFSGNTSSAITSVTWTDGNSSTVGSTNPLTITPLITDNTNYTATIVSSGCTFSPSPSVAVTVNPKPSAPNGNNSTQCGAGAPTATVSDPNGFTNPNFKWYTQAVGGVASQTSTSTTYTSSISGTGLHSFYVSVVNPTTSCESDRTQVDVTVVAPALITVAPGATASICLGSNVSLGATSSNNAYVYTWTLTSYTGSGLSGPTSGASQTVTPTALGTYVYTVTGTDGTCADVKTVTVTVNANPVITSATASPAVLCSGQTVTLQAQSIQSSAATATIGTGTLTNAASSTTSTAYPAPFGNYYWGAKNQMIIKASDLTAAGLLAGNITSVAFDVVTPTTTALTNFTVSMKTTTLSDLSGLAFETTGFSTVFTAPTYTPSASSGYANNTITFTTPFNWDGSSNIIIETCFDNASFTTNGVFNQSTTSYVSTLVYRADISTICSGAPTVTFSYSQRPNMKFGGQVGANLTSSYTWTWSPGGATGSSTTTTATTTTAYTATATNATTGCFSTAATATVTVNPAPTAPAGSNSSQCGSGVPTASVSDPNGFTTPTFNWYTQASGGTAAQSSTSTTYTSSISTVGTNSFYVSVVNPTTGCESNRTLVTVTVTAPPSVSVTPGATTNLCQGGSISLNATSAGVYTYTWSANPAAGSGMVNPLTGAAQTITPTAVGTYIYSVTGTDGTCSNTSTVTATVNAAPVITSVSASPTTICQGSFSTLTSTALNTGTQALPGTYCVPTQSGAAIITDVNFNTISNTGVAQTSPFYNIYPASGGTTTTLLRGQTYLLSVNTNATSIVSAWIDMNRNGVYDASEWIQVWTSNSGGSVFITIPNTATLGWTGLRIRSATTGSTNGSANACTAFTSGSTQDYTVNIVSNPNQGSTINWAWNPGNLTGTSTTVSPSTTTSYAVTATNASTGCTTTSSAVVVTVNPAPTAPAGVNSSQCGTQVPTASVSDPNGFTTPTFKWYSQAVGGTLLQSSTSTTYNSQVSAVGTNSFYVTVTNPATGCESNRTVVTVTVSAPPAITPLPGATTSACLGGNISLNASATPNYTTYSWTANPTSGSGVNGTLSGAAQTVTPTTSGTYVYTVTGTDGTCTNTATVTATVNPNPVITTATATPLSACAGSPITLSASSIVATAGTTDIGTSTTTIGGNDGNPYRSGNGTGNQIRTQLLVTAADLTAAGLTTGNITSLGFTTTSASTGTVSNFIIKMATTNVSALTTTYQTPTFTTVFTQASFTPASSGLNTHTFSTPFFWDGTSNIIVDICQTNNISGTATVNAYTPTYASNVHTANSTTSCTATTGTAVATKPVMTFGGQVGTNLTSSYTWTWSPGGASGSSTTTTATTTTAYTVTATNGTTGCFSTATTQTVTVNPLPSAPTANNSTQCGLGVPTASVISTSGAATPTFKWYSAPSGGTASQSSTSTSYTTSISVTTTFYVTEVGAGGCESSPRTPVTATVNTPPTISVAPGVTTSVCLGGSISLNATQVSYNSFSWTASPSSGSGVSGTLSGAAQTVTPTIVGTYIYTVTGTDGTCTSTATVTATVNPNPVITSATASSNAICVGNSVTLQAASSSSTTYSVGKTIAPLAAAYNTLGAYLIFDASSDFTLNSVVVYPYAASTTSGTLTVALQNSAGTTLQQATFNVTGTSTVTPVTLNLNFSVTTGTGYRLTYLSSTGITGLLRDPSGTASIAFPYTQAGVVSITDGSLAGYYYYFYDWSVTAGIDNTANYTWTWNPGGLNGSTVTATPASTTSYTVTATNASTSCSSTSSPVIVAVGTTLSANASASLSSVCAGGSSLLTATPVGGGAPYTYSWKVQGSNTVLGTASTLSVTPATTTTYQVTITDNCGGTATATVSITVNSLPTVTLTPSGTVNVCSGSQIIGSASNAASPSYQWTLNGVNITSNGTSSSYTASASGSYTLKITNGVTGCNSISSATQLIFNAYPGAITVSPSSATSLCLGNPQSLTASASSNGTVGWTSGTQSAQNTATTFPAPYTVYYGGQRMQFLILASELSAQGFGAGSSLSSIQFPVVSFGANWGTTVTNLQNFQLSIGATSLTALSTFQTGLTQVIAPATFTPVVGYNNSHVFSTPFTWNGTSNIIVETTFSNNLLGSTADGVVQNITTTPFNSTIVYRADNVTAAAAASATTVSIGPLTSRPEFKLNALSGPVRYAWTASPSSNAGLPAGAGTANTANASISATPTAAGSYLYTVTASVSGSSCSTTNSVALTVSQPSVAPTSMTATPATICNGSSTTLTQSGGSLGTGGYWQWYGNSNFTNPIGGHLTSSDASLAVSPTSTSTYYLRAEGSAPCADAGTNAVSVTVTVYQPSVAPTSVNALVSTMCNTGSQSTTITQSGGSLGTNAYWQWYTDAAMTTTIGGQLSSSNASLTVSPTATTTYYLRAEGGTPCANAGDNTISVTVTVYQPAVAPASVSATQTTVCNDGSTTTLTQSGGSLGTNGYWQWYKNSNFTNPVGGHLTSSDASLTLSPTATSSYYLRAEGSAPCANAGTNAVSVTVTVKQPSVAPTSVDATSTAICSGTTVTLTQTGGSLGTSAYWQWYTNANFTTTIGGHLTTSTASLSVTPSSTTTYYLRAEGGSPCANAGDNTMSVTVTVGVGTVAPTSVSATQNPICFGQSTVLTQVGGTLGSGATWHWYDDVTLTNEVFSTTSQSASFVASPTVTTTYYLRAEGGQAPCVTPTTVRSITITVNGSPTISYAGNPFCQTGVAFVTRTGQAGGTYTSDPGMSLNATTGYLYIGSSTVGTHTITYTVPSAGGCNSTGSTIVTILPLPTITLGVAPTICQNTATATLPYTATTGNPTTYSIRSDVNNPMPNYVPVVNVPLSAGSTGTINVQVPANTPGGTYYFDLTVANTHGCVSPGKYVFAVTVATPPTTIISYAGTPFCGTSVGFVTRTPAGGTFSSTPGLNINATTGTIYPAPSTPGNYTVTYTLVLNGCTYTATTPVTILPTPGITIGSIPMMCFSAGAQTALLPYTATSNSPVSYSISADPSSPMANFTPVVDAPLTGSPISVAIPAGTLGGTYKFDLYVKSAQGCSSVRYTFTVTIVSNTTTIAYNGGNPVCQTGTMFVTLSGASGGTYTSDANLNINSATGAIYPAASTLGTHTVTYTITTAGCSFSTTTDVTIVALPKVTIGTIAPVCVSAGAQTASVPYTVTASTPVSYSITVGTSNPMPGYVAVTNAAISNPIVVNIPAGTSPGTYSFYLTLKSAGGCVSSKYTFFVTVKAVPTANIAYTNSPYSTAVSGAAVTNSGTTGGTYSSTAGLNLNTVTGSIFPHQSTPGTYTVTYTVTTAANCTATTTTQVTIVAAPTPRIVSTGTPGKGTTTSKTVPVAAAEVEETITIAPNPVEHRVTVRVSNFSDPMQIRVTDATGKEILKSTKFTSSYGFDMSGYAQGIYMVEVVNEQTGTVTRKKLMKR